MTRSDGRLRFSWNRLQKHISGSVKRTRDDNALVPGCSCFTFAISHPQPSAFPLFPWCENSASAPFGQLTPQTSLKSVVFLVVSGPWSMVFFPQVYGLWSMVYGLPAVPDVPDPPTHASTNIFPLGRFFRSQ